jgi:hypothetical protein
MRVRESPQNGRVEAGPGVGSKIASAASRKWRHLYKGSEEGGGEVDEGKEGLMEVMEELRAFLYPDQAARGH